MIKFLTNNLIPPMGINNSEFLPIVERERESISFNW